MNLHEPTPDDGWGGDWEGTRRTDDCIEELSFGVGDDEDEERGVGER